MDSKHDVVYADDLRVGEKLELGSYTVTEEEILDFARQWDPQWFHVDAAAAEKGSFGGLIASGIQTMAICQRLSVDAFYSRWSVIAGRRIRGTEFIRPVRPDTVLSGTMTIEEIHIEHRNNRGSVALAIELVDERGLQVFTMVTDVYVRCRPNVH
ncbi:MAG: MaoC/PaaZ C-terminal domain-containing protein [Rhodococcus sp. (in: high G+C Gram-positive bacteria)]|uniref:MaoC/PaaZ C-terminal domain-containing protein n=1 Tax=Rhodococcus sp. TaxID=1831 RepID=UPI003BAF885C